jgi:choice-of-anchor C domain-containing protein
VLIADIHYIGTAWEASDGTKSLDLDGLTGSAGAIAQTFSTTPGEMYEVAFDMAGNYGAAPTIKQMRVSADGQSADFDFDITGRTATDMGWTTHSWSFLADDTSATLQFASLTNLSGSVSGWGPALDNVSVTLVPIPAAGLLFGSALAVLGWIRRRSLH